LERPLIVKVRQPVFAAKLRGRVKIQEDFVGDDGQLPGRAYFVEFLHLAGLAEMSRGIIRTDHNDSARARSDGLLQSVKVDLPSVVIQQWITDQFYVVNVRQKTKQRITGFRD